MCFTAKSPKVWHVLYQKNFSPDHVPGTGLSLMKRALTVSVPSIKISLPLTKQEEIFLRCRVELFLILNQPPGTVVAKKTAAFLDCC
jgi:hypothetical protein